MSSSGKCPFSPPPGGGPSLRPDEVAVRAYLRWIRKGRPQGTQLQDWLEAEAEVRQAQVEAVLALLERLPAVVWSVDAELRITAALGEGLSAVGLSPDQVVGRTLYEAFPSREPASPAVSSHVRALRGATALYEQEWGRRRFQVRVVPLPAAGGTVGGCVAVALDVTPPEGAGGGRTPEVWEARLRAEHAVTRALAESGTLADVAARVVRAVGSSLGWSLGVLWQADRPAGVLRCLEVWRAPEAAGPEVEAAVRQLTFAPGVGLPGRVWVTAQPAWVADLTQEAGFAGSALAAHPGLRGACAFPIVLGRQVGGVLEFFGPAVGEPDADLLEMMGIIGSQVGQFLERRQAEQRVQARQQELLVAHKIQQSLLPRAAPVVPGFDIAGASGPAHETGGDYFDFLPLPDGALGLVVGDASGHGVGAALLIAETRAYLRALAQAHADLRTVLAQTNRRFIEDVADYYFVTLFFARLDPTARSLLYVSAGHPTGYLLGPDGQVRARLKSTGWPLGVEAGADFPAAPPLALQPGEVLLLLTDGILEVRSPAGVLFGSGRALDVVRARRREPAGAIADALLAAVRDFAGGQPLDDDCTALVLKVTGD
jgi:serine phosphatase RsbU (regulator of sigma subunit)